MSFTYRVPQPVNEPIRSYAPGDPERESIKATLNRMASEKVDIPLIIGGQEIRTGNTRTALMPHNHGHVLAEYHLAGPDEIRSAIEAAGKAHKTWSRMSWEDRSSVFLRAAHLLETTWRDAINASTMLNQSKTVHQAEIDAACEMIDFIRFNAHFAEQIYSEQPQHSPGVLNRLEYRPLEGFVYAVTPFNFTSIGGNLGGAPAMLGNTVLWKPSSTAIFSNYQMMKVFLEAGLPDGVINFVPGPSAEVTEVILNHRDFAGLHFTGSTPVFRQLWRTAGDNLATYRSYPRIVGETGGKDFILAHPSANVDRLRTAIVRGAFEYQGQKCSAASRAYIPESLWSQLKDDLIAETESLTMGDPRDFRNFMGAVIDKRAFDKIKGFIDRANEASDAEVIAGGQCDDSVGYYVRPTLIQANNPKYESMCEEIFGPVMTINVYPDSEWEQVQTTLDETSEYALTGAVFAEDRSVLRAASDRLRYAAGNFYLNDKPTGAVVGQQPFGGARGSGTNDKAGSALNLVRWLSPRTIKETLVSPTDYRYPFMDAE
jgi:1-pyrroline-5-carboxylate dehydrogenase